VTGTFTAADKQYDGNATATLSAPVVNVAISGDLVSLTGGVGAFADKNVGANKPVTVTGASLSGADANNYSLGAVTANNAAITPKTVVGSFTAQSRAYDGTTAATILTRSLSGSLGAEDVALSGGMATFADKTVGTAKTVTATGFSLAGTGKDNYTLGGVTTWTTAADITAIGLIGSFTAQNRVYDSTTAATILTRLLTGKLGTDDVTLSGGTAGFADKNIGISKIVTLVGATLTGLDAPNYTLSLVHTANANITPLSITGSFTAANKVYDGTTVAAVQTQSPAGVFSGDVVSLAGGSATFADKNVGTKAVTLTGAMLTGIDAPNYSLAGVSAATASITPAPLTVTASSGVLIVGSTVPAITPIYSAFVSGDTVANSVTTPPVCGTAYTSSSGVGPYATICANAVAPNYAISYYAGSIQVVFGWDGFLQPINDTAHQTSLTQSKFRTGQTIPAKFVLTNAAGAVVQQATNPTFTRSANLGGCDATAAIENLTALEPDGTPIYAWDGSQYHFNWSTKGLTSGRYRIFANLTDGTARSVDICLTK
jgi:trimeric autotransporter adhesin